MRPSYWQYIRVDDLLDLQHGIDGDETALGNEEVLFIVAHQVHELWFKLVLRELAAARDLFNRETVPENALAQAARGMRRVARIFHTAAQHFSLMETMTTRDFLDFRDKLVPASGFQSPQFREIEILLGLDESSRVRFGSESNSMAVLQEEDGQKSSAAHRVEARLRDRPSLCEALEKWLYRTPIEGSFPTDPADAEVVDDFLRRFLERHREEAEGNAEHAGRQSFSEGDIERLSASYREQIRSAEEFLLHEDPHERRVRAAILFIESYRELPLLAWPREMLDLAVEVEQALLIFRQRHARMVERMIGRRVGTGGSAGVDYLDETALRYRVFSNIWAIRTLLLRERQIPELQNPEIYGFKKP